MKSLLVADDHLMFGNAMAYMLSQLDPDVRVVAVGSADQALQQLGTDGPFDLVLLDYDMPRTNGLQGLELIQQQFPDQTVGMLSGRSDAQLVKSAIDGGAIGVLDIAETDQAVTGLLHCLERFAPLLWVDRDGLNLPRKKGPSRNRHQMQGLRQDIIRHRGCLLRILGDNHVYIYRFFLVSHA